MNEILVLGLGFTAVVLILLVWLRDWLFRCCAIGLTIVAYSAGYLQLSLPVRVLMLVLVLTMIAYLLASKPSAIDPRERLLLVGLTVLCCLGFGLGQVLIPASATDSLFRYTLLYPSMFVAGYLVSKGGKEIAFSRIYVYVSLSMALLAVIERLRGTFFVAGSYEYADRLIRDGNLRSVAFAEHPLVLSVLLAAATPFVPMTFKSLGPRCVVYSVLVAGVLSTNSRGALTIVAAWFVIRVASKINFLTPAAARVAKGIGFVCGVWAFLTIILGDGIDELTSASGVDASAEYRGALYTFAVRSLIEQPWGWGISGLPEGVYLLPSHFGVLDISKTVDSELALAMFDFGWVGLFAFVGVLFMQVRAASLSNPLGQAAIMVTASGFYLALHSWVGLGSVWILLAGLALGYLRTGRGTRNLDRTAEYTRTSSLRNRHQGLHRPYRAAQEIREK